MARMKRTAAWLSRISARKEICLKVSAIPRTSAQCTLRMRSRTTREPCAPERRAGGKDSFPARRLARRSSAPVMTEGFVQTARQIFSTVQ